MIELKHLNIVFDNLTIFKDADFNTCSGKITGIIGKSGCGKTTFLKSLLYQYTNQVLSVDGLIINNQNKEDYLLNHVSYIDQFGTYFENMTIKQHFEFINHLKNKDFDQTEMFNVLHLVGLDMIETTCFPSALSIGQRKRFLIALSIYKDTSIIIIDEPTASLDQENKEIILKILEKLKSENKYIIITTHDEYLINHLDITYRIENKKLICDHKIEDLKNDIEIPKINIRHYKKYFFYKNHRQWFQFILVLFLGFIMTISISTNISDSLLQENKLSNGVKQANKAELYMGKYNDQYIQNGVDNYYIGDIETNLDVNDNELKQIKSIKHIKGVYPFDVFDTINQMENVDTGNVYYEREKTSFNYFQGGSPLVIPYYSFQNIKSNGKQIKGNVISKALANKLGIEENKKDFKISIDVYIPVKQYTYQDESNRSLGQILTKKVKLDIQIDQIISTDDYYNDFLSTSYFVLMKDQSFYDILNKYCNQTPDSLLDAEELKAIVSPYHTKNYIVEVDRIHNLKNVEKDISNVSKNIITYDQYNSVIDTVEVYKEERKNRYVFIVIVILIAIFLYVMIQINALDDRKNEIKLLKLNGYKNNDISSVLKDNIIIQSVVSVLLSIPGFFIARKMGFFIINRQSILLSLSLNTGIQIFILIIIYCLYVCYVKWFVKKVDL